MNLAAIPPYQSRYRYLNVSRLVAITPEPPWADVLYFTMRLEFEVGGVLGIEAVAVRVESQGSVRVCDGPGIFMPVAYLGEVNFRSPMSKLS